LPARLSAGDLLPFMKVMQAGPFDRADMDEYIGAAGVRLNEPEAFAALNHFTVPVAMARSSRVGRRT
jgi:hypothetical protein